MYQTFKLRADSGSNQVPLAVFNNTEDDIQNESKYIPYECNHNIYNAFLIANYREDIKFKDNDIIKAEMKYGLGIAAYVTAFTQWIAFVFLISCIITNSDVSRKTVSKELFDFRSLSMKNGYGLFMWTFFAIGITVCLREAFQSNRDRAVLKHWGISSNIFIWRNGRITYNKSCNLHALFLKHFCEILLGYIGGFIYLFVIAVYSDYEWEDMLNTILNLLAYQFILEADEWIYTVLQYTIQYNITMSSEFDFENFFKGMMEVSCNEHRIRKSSKLACAKWTGQLAFLLGYSVWLTALFTRSSILFVVSDIWLGVFGIFTVLFMLVRSRRLW